MARLKFDLQPFSREDENWRTQEENDAWVRTCWANWGREGDPSPCDCGYWNDGWLVTCDEVERKGCRSRVRQRLEDAYRHRHLAGLKKKREFPPLPRNTEKHQCWWCKKPMVHGRVWQRAMHDGRLDEPNCRWLHDLHTRYEVQRAFLIRRDGMGCKGCGQVVGHWSQSHEVDPERWRAWGPEWAKRYPADVWVGPLCSTHWAPGLEVDHVVPLAAAFEAFPEPYRRRWFFGPSNLQALCPDCHKAKTRKDVAFIRAAQVHGQAWARSEVLRILADAHLLALARPKGATGENPA